MTELLLDLETIKTNDPSVLHMIPIGGVGEFGMNCMGYYHQNRLFMVDCGMTFADPSKLGVDIIIPEVDTLLETLGGVHSYWMTHGHEDHIGALPFLIKRWPAPIYATAWTAALLREKWEKHGISLVDHPITIVEAGDKMAAENIDIEWFHINHSIPMTCSLIISTPAGRIFHTGDFKIDLGSEHEPPVDLDHLATIGERGISLLVCDSTNAPAPGCSEGEASVGPALEAEMRAATGAIFVSTFASNFWRLKTIVNACQKLGKRLFIAGSGLARTLNIADELGIGGFPKEVFLEESALSQISRDRLVVMATGCQGEHRAALGRIIRGEHPLVALREGDTVIFSSRIVPGNERTVLGLISQCAKIGARVVTGRHNPAIHVSGHAYAGEIEKMLELLKPRNFLPVHGTFTQLAANLELGAGKSAVNSVGFENGEVLKLARGDVEIVGNVGGERLYVDSWSRIPMPYTSLRERLKIGDSGLAVASGVYSLKGAKWLAPLDFEFIGLTFPGHLDLGDWVERLKERLTRQIASVKNGGTSGTEDLNESCRIVLRRELTALFVKKPVVISKIHFL